MKTSVWVLIILVIIAGGTAYYFLKPANLPVDIKTRQSITDTCILLAQQTIYDPTSLTATTINECSELGFQRFACEAVLRNDPNYLESGQAQKDCAQLAIYEAVVESQDKRNCNKLENTALKQECLTILS